LVKIISLSIKRFSDILISGVGILISLPLWVMSAIIIVMDSGGPIFILQERIGKNGKKFNILKFRTMDKFAHKEDPGNHDFEERDNRVTRVGKILRITAMDELPQLFSIFIGDMSFVGPRAVHPTAGLVGSKYHHIEDIPDFNKRNSVVPGLTGLAQIFARKDEAIENKMKYDLLYIERQNILFDLKLFLLSFMVTFLGRWEVTGNKLKFKY
jgi:lipopolysaccharide/colanic/teichoic acid biosynthesis glycosyltransferase